MVPFPGVRHFLVSGCMTEIGAITRPLSGPFEFRLIVGLSIFLFMRIVKTFMRCQVSSLPFPSAYVVSLMRYHVLIGRV